MNFGQFKRAVKGYSNRIKMQMRNLDDLNLLLGRYVAYAFHDQKHYPTESFLSRQDKMLQPKAATSDAQRIAYVAVRYSKKRV